MTRAGNGRKNNRIQAPMLDPHVRPREGAVKLASSVAVIVNEKSHAPTYLFQSATLYHIEVLLATSPIGRFCCKSRMLSAANKKAGGRFAAK
jgi:hypothetical protein